MDKVARSVICWKCRLGRHRWLFVNERNPGQRRGTHRECACCLKIKDDTPFEHALTTWVTMGPRR